MIGRNLDPCLSTSVSSEMPGVLSARNKNRTRKGRKTIIKVARNETAAAERALPDFEIFEYV